MTTGKKLLIALWGIIYGTLGTIWGLTGLFWAYPLDSSPGTKEWAEDCQFIPLGYGMLAVWAIAMFISCFALRKSKNGIIVFFGAWFAGILICISLMCARLQYMLG